MPAVFHARLLAAVLLSCVAIPATATVQAETQHRSGLVLVADENYPPFSYRDATGRPTGFDVEFFREVARQAGFDPVVRLLPWERALAEVEDGRAHLVPLLRSAPRESRFVFSNPFLHRHHLVFGRTGSEFVGETSQLRGHRVAVQRAGMAWEEISTEPDLKIVDVPVEGEALAAVASGAADYALVPTYIGFEALRRMQLDDIVVVSPPLLEQPYAFALSPRHAGIKAQIDAGIAAATVSGAHSRLYLRWLANLVPPEEVYESGLQRGLLVALLFLLASVAAALAWMFARKRALEESLRRSDAERRALELERFDAATGLAHRPLFESHLDAALRDGGSWCLLVIEVEDLPTIDACAGQEARNGVAREVAERLASVRPGALCGRAGHDRFALAVPGAPEDCSHLAEDVLRVVRSASLGNVQLELTVRGGFAHAALDGESAAALMRKASIALAAARARSRTCVAYRPEQEPDPRHVTLLGDLAQAIESDAVGFALQPKVHLGTGQVVGAELLVRWNHLKYGPIRPDDFIPLAERTEVIGVLTCYMIGRASEVAAGWEATGTDGAIAVNVSANDFTSKKVVESIRGLFAGREQRLILEVTETAVMSQPEETLAVIRSLRASGFRFALDDFGTGNASLTHLSQIRPDEVKIDRTFVSAALVSEADMEIVESSIKLAHALGASVTAEGVEDHATALWLQSVGCDFAQGHLYAEAMSKEEYARLPAKLPRD